MIRAPTWTRFAVRWINSRCQRAALCAERYDAARGGRPAAAARRFPTTSGRTARRSSMSSSVFQRPRVRRTVPAATSGPSPMALRTWEGSRLPEVQADPLLAATPCKSSASKMDREDAYRLRGVGVHQNPALSRDATDLRHGFQRADFIVGVDHRDQHGVGADGRAHIVWVHPAIPVDREIRHIKPARLKKPDGFQHGVVLDRGGDDMPASGLV